MHPSPGPISLISMQFSAKILPNNRFCPESRGWHPPTRLGNPGSATALFIKFDSLMIFILCGEKCTGFKIIFKVMFVGKEK